MGASPATAPIDDAAAPRSLDDVLLAMDVVDTLRHRQQVVGRELDKAGREAELIDRLREIYAAQGIEVPDAILKQGVEALEARRFAYSPPEPSLQVSLARLYVSRDRWLKPIAGGLVAIMAAGAIYQFAIAGPARARGEAVRVELASTLPTELATLRDAARGAATENAARALAETYYQDGIAAAAAGDRDGARAALQRLRILQGDLKATYQVRVVYGPGEERSGIFRIPDTDPEARNYYLLVEAVDPAGRVLEVPVTSEEDQTRRRVSRWGQRVSEAVFFEVARDKDDDQIIQRAIIGEKPAGRLTPIYSVATPGGAIVEW